MVAPQSSAVAQANSGNKDNPGEVFTTSTCSGSGFAFRVCGSHGRLRHTGGDGHALCVRSGWWWLVEWQAEVLEHTLCPVINRTL